MDLSLYGSGIQSQQFIMNQFLYQRSNVTAFQIAHAFGAMNRRQILKPTIYPGSMRIYTKAELNFPQGASMLKPWSYAPIPSPVIDYSLQVPGGGNNVYGG